MSWKGRFRPNNPQKYNGNANDIIYRSSLELKVMRRLDSSPDILWWNSECLAIPYYNPAKRRSARYFPDFLYCRKGERGPETVMVEVKPHSQTHRPTHKPGKRRSRIVSEELEWAVNDAKWAAAREFCERNGWEFTILTEREIWYPKSHRDGTGRSREPRTQRRRTAPA